MIRGHNVMHGYSASPEATAEAIDATAGSPPATSATVDEDGYFFIVDRKKDMIIRGGYNVYPREIEEVLHEHPAVAEVAVLGIPHDDLGEEVGAAVVLKPGEAAEPDELRRSPRSGSRPTSTRARVDHRRAAEGRDGQDPEARDRGAGRREGVAGRRTRRVRRFERPRASITCLLGLPN